MKKDIKYIIKRIIIGVGIILVMSLIRTCEVKALEYPLEIRNATFYVATPNTTSTITGRPNQFIIANDWQAFWKVVLPTTIHLELNQNPDVTMMYQGQYLIEFYIYSNRGIREDLKCYQLSSNFENINITTGNWVSNEIHSQCIDLYKTTYNNVDAYRILYKFTYNGGTYGSDGVETFRFTINSSPNDFFTYQNLDVIGASYSNIYDYDPNMISQFNLEKNSQISIENSKIMINQNNTMINQNSQINQSIQSQTQQQHQDWLDTQNTLTDSSIPSDTNSKVNNILTHATASSNANISDLVNFIPNLIQRIINGFNTSCTGGYSLGTLFGTELIIPCINPVDYLGSFLWGVIDSILCLCYLVPLCKFLVNKYNELTSLKNLRWE